MPLYNDTICYTPVCYNILLYNTYLCYTSLAKTHLYAIVEHPTLLHTCMIQYLQYNIPS